MSDYKYVLMGENDEKMPDVFNLAQSSFETLDTPIPPTYVLTKQDAERFDLTMYSFYKDESFTSIVLWYNGIPSKYHLYEGMEINLPDLATLQTFKKKAWYL